MSVKPSITLHIIMLVILYACQTDKKIPEPITPTVRVEEVEIDTIATRYSSVGYIYAIRNISITPRTSGYLLTIDYAAGEPVRRGQRLFTIDSRLASTTLAAAEAELASAKARLTQSQSSYERALPLAAIEAISLSQMESYEAEFRAAQAQVASCIEQVERARIEVGYATIYAPVAGIISRCRAEVGDYVGEGTESSELATIAITDSMSMDATLPVRLYLQQTGLRHTSYDNAHLLSHITLYLADGSRYPYPGEYSYTKQGVSPQSGVMEFVINFPNPDDVLKMGEFARIEFDVGQAVPYVVVAIDAITQLQNLDFVWVIDSNNMASQRMVTLGEVVGDKRVVKEGLKVGERVVVGDSQGLHTGDRVIVKR